MKLCPYYEVLKLVIVLYVISCNGLKIFGVVGELMIFVRPVGNAFDQRHVSLFFSSSMSSSSQEHNWPVKNPVVYMNAFFLLFLPSEKRDSLVQKCYFLK